MSWRKRAAAAAPDARRAAAEAEAESYSQIARGFTCGTALVAHPPPRQELSAQADITLS